MVCLLTAWLLSADVWFHADVQGTMLGIAPTGDKTFRSRFLKTHYHPPDRRMPKDRIALKTIEKLDGIATVAQKSKPKEV